MGQGDIDMVFDGGNDNHEEDRSAGDQSTREPSPAGSVDGAQDPAAPSRINKVYHPTINGQSFTVTIG